MATIHDLCAAVDEDVARPDSPKTVMAQMIELARQTRSERDDAMAALRAAESREAGLREACIDTVEYDDGRLMQSYQRCRLCFENDLDDGSIEHNPDCLLAAPGRPDLEGKDG